MIQKLVVLRRPAEDDIDAAIAYYLNEAGADVAADFVEQLEESIKKISKHPASGIPRYAHELYITDLRYWSMKRFPYLIFYIEKERYIEIGRVLHSSRDIPSAMDESD